MLNFNFFNLCYLLCFQSSWRRRRWRRSKWRQRKSGFRCWSQPATLPSVVHFRGPSVSTPSREDPRGHVCRALSSGSGHSSDEPHPGKDCYASAHRGRGSERWARGHSAPSAASHISSDICSNNDWWIYWKVRELLYLKLKECAEQRFGDATVVEFFLLCRFLLRLQFHISLLPFEVQCLSVDRNCSGMLIRDQDTSTSFFQ